MRDKRGMRGEEGRGRERVALAMVSKSRIFFFFVAGEGGWGLRVLLYCLNHQIARHIITSISPCLCLCCINVYISIIW